MDTFDWLEEVDYESEEEIDAPNDVSAFMRALDQSRIPHIVNDMIVYLSGLGIVNFHSFPAWFDQIESVRVSSSGRELTASSMTNNIVYRILRNQRRHSDLDSFGLDGIRLQGDRRDTDGTVSVYPDGTFVRLANVEFVKYRGTKRETFYLGNCATLPRKPLNFRVPPGIKTLNIIQPQDFGAFYNPVHGIVISGNKFAEIPKFHYIDKAPFNIVADNDVEYVLFKTKSDVYASNATECIKFRDINNCRVEGPTSMFAKHIPENDLIFQIGEVTLELVNGIYCELGYIMGSGRFTKAVSSFVQ